MKKDMSSDEIIAHTKNDLEYIGTSITKLADTVCAIRLERDELLAKNIMREQEIAELQSRVATMQTSVRMGGKTAHKILRALNEALEDMTEWHAAYNSRQSRDGSWDARKCDGCTTCLESMPSVRQAITTMRMLMVRVGVDPDTGKEAALVVGGA